MADIIVPIGGWSRFGWGEMPWGQTDLPKATGNVASVSVVAEANIPATGLQASAGVGSVSITANANISPAGVSSSGQVGSVTTVAEANIKVFLPRAVLVPLLQPPQPMFLRQVFLVLDRLALSLPEFLFQFPLLA
jgi:hypothetical protein